VRFEILGPLEVLTDDGGRCAPSAGRERRLLLALLVAGGDAVSVDHLVSAVWSGDEDLPRHPVATVRTYLARLRRGLPADTEDDEPLVVGGPERYRLRLAGHQVDAVLFDDDVAAASAVIDDDPDRALRCLERGLARWRGRALEDVADEDWARPEAVRLDELRVMAEELRFRCLLDTGQHAEAVPEIERHVRLHPLRERPSGQLMVALHRSGRTADAAATFRAFRDRLVDDAGLEPSADLHQLHRRLLADGGDDQVLGRRTTVSAGPPPPVSPQLPPARTRLVGRDAQIAAVTALLARSRLVTLTGVGGVGKTRLAMEVARGQHAEGRRVVFVDLSVVSDDGDVVEAVLDALQLAGEARGDHLDGAVRVLASGPALLLLDNCEHVVDAAAALTDRLTLECPELTVLATSRELLRLEGEHAYRVPPLEPAAGVELFLARAAEVVAAEVEPGELDRVQDICRHLDGVPLAIELAAARCSHMSVPAIAAHLDERFWLLAGGRRSAGRHRTLQAAMDWSYDLLDDEDRAVLRAASVFVGGFDAQALAAVADRSESDTLDRLGVLVTSSLVELVPGGARTRYRLLETVRHYAYERLTDAGEAATRTQAHARHYLSRALAHPPVIVDLPPWGLSGQIDEDDRNHLGALDWFVRQGELVDLGRLASRLSTVVGAGGVVDGACRYLGRADVMAALQEPAEQALYLTASALNASYLGRFRDQLELGASAMAESTDPATRAAAAILTANACTIFDPHRIPGLIETGLQDLPDTAATIRQDLELQRPLGLIMQGRLDDAAGLLEDLLADGQGFAGAELMFVRHLLGQDDLALAIPVPGDIDTGYGIFDYRWTLVRALVAAARQELEEAQHHLTSAAAQARSSPLRLLTHDVLVGVAAVAHHAGADERAATLLASFRGTVRSPATFATYLHYRDRIKAQLPAERRQAIIRGAAELDPGKLLEEELTTAGTGSPRRGRGSALAGRVVRAAEQRRPVDPAVPSPPRSG
jgi:predicted ATPase/DNA-binding SARP family transcriptional activator